MAASRTLPKLHQSNNLVVPQPGIVTLFGYGVRVCVDHGHLIIEDGIAYDRRSFRLPRVGHGLKRLVIIGSDGVISLAALRWMACQDVAFVLLERDGSVLATTGPVRSSDARLRRAQALALQNGAALSISRDLISQKLEGQERVARDRLLDSSTADAIAESLMDLPAAETIAAVRLIESQAALAYWSAWRTLPIMFPKKDLPRVPDHWRAFGSRVSPLSGSPRLAATPPNACLNYLYAVLESEARLAAAALALDCGLGVLHVDTPHRDSLACDLMEPVRPQVDAYLLDWITQEPLRREWFFEERNGNARLMGSFAVRLSETAPMWRRAVAPVAEWVAQAILTSYDREGQAAPTPLTQRRRSEGRGKEFAPPTIQALKGARVCEICGVEGIKNRYCKACALEISKQTMARAALIGHAQPKSRGVKARISTKLSDHAVANSWWSPAEQPAWLTERVYAEEIQPRLTSLKVREIAEALQVSQPYAAQIRAGRRRPHPRHWQALAGLLGIM